MSWYYADNGRQAGPVDDASLDALISQGVVRPDTLVWREGMANWQALNSVRPVAPPAPAPPPPAAAPVYTPPPQASFQPPQQQQQPSFQQPSFQQPQQPLFQAPAAAMGAAVAGAAPGGVTCANCGQLFAQTDVVFIGSSYVCAGCKPVFLQRMREGSAGGAVGARRYAGFWIRAVALIIDALVLIIPLSPFYIFYYIPMLTRMSSGDSMGAFWAIVGAFSLLGLALGCAYQGYFLSTKGATPGKMVVGLKVMRSDGSNLTFLRAAMRYLATSGIAMVPLLGSLILIVGYIVAAFDAEKRTIFDHICDTRVVYK